MSTSRHGEHLTSITRLRAVNCYLVREPDGLTLIDTMIPGSLSEISAAVRDAGLPLARITITHGHLDHVGSVDEVARRFSDAEVIFPAREARLLRGDRTREPDEPKDPPGAAWWSKGSIRPIKTTPARAVAPGDRIGSLEVVAAPGHTPGQVALLDTRDGTLIAGDAYSTLGGISAASKANPRFPLPAMGTWDKPSALRTARALRALEPARLAVGHGPVLEDPGAAMDAAIAAAS